ncbi:hypothetical protein ACFSM5_07015 [Lacibacterium aquatile]|uniref:Flagellar hook-length control protein FliK n=1 Tax=Lacibacterium aquatile TaxID=1168082 RepID=A0ABW5DND3_9PROT
MLRPLPSAPQPAPAQAAPKAAMFQELKAEPAPVRTAPATSATPASSQVISQPATPAPQTAVVSQAPLAAAPTVEAEAPAPPPPAAAPAPTPEKAPIPSVVGGRTQATIISVTPPGQQPPVPPQVTARQGQVVQATVVGTANGRPLVSLEGSLLSIEARPLPTGTQVTMLLPPLPTVTAARPAPAVFPTYPSLPAVAETASQLGGQPAAVMAAILPKLGPRLAAELMVVASAFTRGDIRPLVSDGVRQQIDRAGRTKAASALAGEVAEGSREASKNTAAEWRMITLPIHTGQSIEPIRLWLHAAPEADEDGKGQKGGEAQDTRFMIDLTLSKLGAIQIDGLARPGKLDLVFRTPGQLPQQIRRELNAVYVAAASAHNIAGGVAFQVAPPLKPEIKPQVSRPGWVV